MSIEKISTDPIIINDWTVTLNSDKPRFRECEKKQRCLERQILCVLNKNALSLCGYRLGDEKDGMGRIIVNCEALVICRIGFEYVEKMKGVKIGKVRELVSALENRHGVNPRFSELSLKITLWVDPRHGIEFEPNGDAPSLLVTPFGANQKFVRLFKGSCWSFNTRPIKW